jgi:hypothetical protein
MFARRALPLMLPLLLLGNCTDVPDLGAAVPGWVDDAPYPDLLPLGTALTPLPRPAEAAETINADLAARTARLQERARALQAPVVDDATRRRMDAGIPL